MFRIMAGHAQRLDRRRHVAVVDFRRTNLLRALAGAVFVRVPAGRSFIHVDLAQNAQGVDPASRAAACRSRLNFPRPFVSDDLLHGRIDRHDLGNESAGEFGSDPTAFALAVPGAEQKGVRRELQQRGRVRRRRRSQAAPVLAFHEGLAVDMAVPQDRVIYAMRRVHRRYPLQRRQFGGAKIDGHVRQRQAGARVAVVGRREKGLLQPVGLALDAVQQDAPDLPPIDPSLLENMARGVVPASARPGRRKDLVTRAAGRLKALNAPQRGVVRHGIVQCRQLERHRESSFLSRDGLGSRMVGGPDLTTCGAVGADRWAMGPSATPFAVTATVIRAAAHCNRSIWICVSMSCPFNRCNLIRWSILRGI